MSSWLTVLSNFSTSETLYTTPYSRAFSAPNGSPVIANWVALVKPMALPKRNRPPASGAKPTPTKAWINFALSEVIQKSAATAILAVAPATAPSATIITGFGICFIFLEIWLTNSAICVKESISSASTARFISAKSPPTEKTLPTALNKIKRTSGFFSANSNASRISWHIGMLKPFETSGLFKIIDARSSSTE